MKPPDGFRVKTHPLLPGVHILYAYATDGQDATSTMTTTGGGSSPLVGAISSYPFVVVPPSGPPAGSPSVGVIPPAPLIDFGSEP